MICTSMGRCLVLIEDKRMKKVDELTFSRVERLRELQDLRNEIVGTWEPRAPYAMVLEYREEVRTKLHEIEGAICSLATDDELLELI